MLMAIIALGERIKLISGDKLTPLASVWALGALVRRLLVAMSLVCSR